MDTIFAQSSHPGKAGISVFRISGPNSLLILQQLLLSNNRITISPKIMYYKKIYNPNTKELIDHAMILHFKAPKSFTGEDVIEIHTHGSIAIMKILYSALLNTGLARLAEAGEFTRRGFLNGKFDLTAAEGIIDLINAETAMQHKQAVNQTDGVLYRLYDQWRAKLLRLIGNLEACLDFPDEDIPTDTINNAYHIIKDLINSITLHLNDKNQGELLRNGIKLAILGLPNVGKSSLLNFLIQRNIAITSNIPGTTRDIIEANIDIGGYQLILQDTAGIRSTTNDIIEQEGINRALNAAKNADIKLIVTDTISFDNHLLPPGINEIIDENTIIVLNKIDLKYDDTRFKTIATQYSNQLLKISVKENIGLDSLIQTIESIASNIAGLSENPQITRQRHRYELEQTISYLLKFDINQDLVCITEDIRNAIKHLGNITGEITVEEILGEIFSNFCIGK